VTLQRVLTGGGDREAQLRDLYEKTKDQACVSHILVKAGENAGKLDPQSGAPLVPPDADYQAALVRATQLRAEIVGGADFAATAKASSDDPGSKDQGGDLGCQARGVYLDALDDAIWNAVPGQVTEPVKTEFGYHLILVRERTTPTFEASRPRLEEALSSQEASALQSWLQQASRNAKVAVNPTFGVWDADNGTITNPKNQTDLTLAPVAPGAPTTVTMPATPTTPTTR
jgi:parvulin-like peptidyl-prolyl isomerase